MRSSLLCALVLVSGCALFRSSSSGPARPAPEEPGPEIPLPGAGDGARADETAELRSAIAVYSLANPDPGKAALEQFIKRHPRSPQTPIAAALLARMALHRGDAIAARAILERHAGDSPEAPVRFVRGLTEARGGSPARALELLAPFSDAGPPPVGVDPDEAELALRAALGDARLAGGDVAGAYAEWERYLRQREAREPEKAFARQRADEIATRVKDDVAAQVYRGGGELARAALGGRAAASLRARGDADGARRIDEEAADLRKSLGFGAGPGGLGPGDPHRLGLLAPFSGSAFLLGEVVLRGAMLAIGDAGASGEPAGFQIVVRDAAPERDTARRAAFELVRDESAIGIVGVGDRRAVDSALSDGVPVLLIDESAPGPASTAFQVLHTPELRAAELARRALVLGARRFAVLAPETPAGRRLADAFARAAGAGGGRVVAQASYPTGASNFTAPVNTIKRAAFEAVFVADDARRLELLAPALAAGDLWPTPWASRGAPSAPRPPGMPPRRDVLLLSTAVGLGPQLLRNAGRYVQGALLAPGFFPDGDDPRSGRFVTQYRLLYGQDPGAADAYAYDAFRLLASVVARGASSRIDLARGLASQPGSYEGVTGPVRFGPDHTRVDPPAVYTVEGDAIRALR
jgi:branched-chain amino acid transport system substrate-binding protein